MNIDQYRELIKKIIDKIDVDKLEGDELDKVSSMLDYSIWVMTGKMMQCLKKQTK